MNREWVLRSQRLTLGYGRKALFRDLSFEITRGEILGLVGPNGCGKTTLLRTMLGLLEPLEGRVERQPGLSISYVPQRERIDRIIPVTVLEVVLMGPSAKAPALQRVRSTERDAANRALALLGIESLWPDTVSHPFHGTAAACAVGPSAHDRPGRARADEPTVGMDLASEAAIIDFLRDLNRRRSVTILIVTHLLPIVLNLASYWRGRRRRRPRNRRALDIHAPDVASNGCAACGLERSGHVRYSSRFERRSAVSGARFVFLP